MRTDIHELASLVSMEAVKTLGSWGTDVERFVHELRRRLNTEWQLIIRVSPCAEVAIVIQLGNERNKHHGHL